MSTARFPPLMGRYMNPEELVCSAIPDLCMGELGVETTSSAPTIVRFYANDIAPWNTFTTEVINWYRSQEIQDAFSACSLKPMYMHPDVENQSFYAMTKELGQVGAEISVSGRFTQNVILPVLHVARTMKNPQGGGRTDCVITFGDAHIEPRPRTSTLFPDVVMKLTHGASSEVRMVGEIKNCATVNLQDMHNAAKQGIADDLSRILGQIIEYMLLHKTTYGFISSYKHTIFVKLGLSGDGKPRIEYSACIANTKAVDLSRSQISVRLALLYLTFKCSSLEDDGWKIPPEHLAVTNNWISRNRVEARPTATPAPSAFAYLGEVPPASRRYGEPTDPQDGTPSKPLRRVYGPDSS